MHSVKGYCLSLSNATLCAQSPRCMHTPHRFPISTEAVTRELHEAMDGCLDRVMRATQVLFFGLAGANLRLVRVATRITTPHHHLLIHCPHRARCWVVQASRSCST